MKAKTFGYEDVKVRTWRKVAEAADYLSRHSWLFRGHGNADWNLETSIERQFKTSASKVELEVLWHFVRTAPRLLPAHLIPNDNDAAAWFGLIQHYGGPTRLLDVTRSPYVALFFAFEPVGKSDRVIWAFDNGWTMLECARIMAARERTDGKEMLKRTMGCQAQIVYSLVHQEPYPGPLFRTFKPFTGVFPLDPWKPDARQSAQQAMFLCAANLGVSFEENLAAHRQVKHSAYRITMPASLRDEVLHQLSMMNVTAATLFPDLVGLARSSLFSG